MNKSFCKRCNIEHSKEKGKQIHSVVDPVHYDQIPDFCFKFNGSILDIGCMSGKNALLSRHKGFFYSAEANRQYLGVDLLEYPRKYISPIIQSDIRYFRTMDTFDLVLALHVLEHIEIEYWSLVISKLQRFTKPNGFLVIAVPYKSPEPREENDGPHEVFNISEETILEYLPDATFIKQRGPYRYFRDQGENWLWSVIRALYRIFTRHKYKWRRYTNLIAIWRATN